MHHYYIEEQVTKAGYRPLDEDEWRIVITNGNIVGDRTVGEQRTRVVHLDGKWYCWSTEGNSMPSPAHTCWELGPDAPSLYLEDYNKLKFLIQDISKYMHL